MHRQTVLHLIDSGGMYGAEKVVLTLLEELRETEFAGILGCIRRHETEIPQIAKECVQLGIPVKFFSVKHSLDLRGLRDILRFIRDTGTRLLHCHGYKPDILMGFVWRRHFKTLSTVHGWAKDTANGKVRVYEFLDSIALRRLDMVVAVSTAVRRDLLGRGLCDNALATIYNGLSPCSTQTVADALCGRKTYQLPNGAFVIGSVGRLTRIKGHLHLIRTMPRVISEIGPSMLIIAGEGPLRGELEGLVHALNLTPYVKLLGYVHDMRQFLAAIDVLALPSFSEGLPISLLEAMAAGKPVIASAVGGIPEVITGDDVGVLVPPADEKALAEAIINLFRQTDRRQRISSASQELVHNKFSSQTMARHYLSLYSKLVA